MPDPHFSFIALFSAGLVTVRCLRMATTPGGGVRPARHAGEGHQPPPGLCEMLGQFRCTCPNSKYRLHRGAVCDCNRKCRSK